MFVAVSGQIDGFLEQIAQGFQVSLLVMGHDIAEVLAAAQQVAIAAALDDVEDIVGFQAIDHEIAVEIGAENVLGNLMAASTGAGADGVDGGAFAAEDPQPGVEPADAPAGFVGMDDVALAQGVDEQVVGGLGQVGQSLLGADEGGGAHFELAIGRKKSQILR